MALTDTEIRKAKVKASAYRMSDGGGLYIWITPPGGKRWRWKYRYEGEEKLVSFGVYSAMSLNFAKEHCSGARNQHESQQIDMS